jgi:hypothetical protein
MKKQLKTVLLTAIAFCLVSPLCGAESKTEVKKLSDAKVQAMPIGSFEPMVGNGMHKSSMLSSGVGSQEVELGSSDFLLQEPATTPMAVFLAHIKHLPEPLHKTALGHFWQRDSLLKGNVTFEDAVGLARLYHDMHSKSLLQEKKKNK